MADFLREEVPGIGMVTKLSRLDNGMIMCCICYEFKYPDQLYVDADGQKWDMCIACGARENITSTTWFG
jgi:hypothetical protein